MKKLFILSRFILTFIFLFLIQNGAFPKQGFTSEESCSNNGNDSYTKLLLHLESNFLDSGISQHQVYNNGAVITQESPFEGSYSAYFGGSDYLYITDSSDFDFVGDFTIDFWIKSTSMNYSLLISGYRAYSYNGWYVYLFDGRVRMDGLSPDFRVESGIGTVSTGQWSHVAIIRNKNDIVLFLNGNIIDSVSDISDTIDATPIYNLHIGGRPSEYFLDGYIDEIRISNGIDRTQDPNDPLYIPEGYDTFTPPTAPYDFIDQDCDGIDDNQDNCPYTQNGPHNGTCTSGDSTGDNCTDNTTCGTGEFCSMNQEDYDNDTIGDACDNCIYTVNPSQIDCDNDTWGDECDPDGITDTDGDGIGDACDNCTDTDSDGFGNPEFSKNVCPLDNCPYDPNNDFDSDAICGDVDNCPHTPNGTELGSCVKIVAGVFVRTGELCSDNGACEEDELCEVYQLDINNNGIGDACECYAEVSGDGKVNSKDLLVLKIDYNRKDCFVTPCDADCNDDGKVNSSDLLIMKLQYNSSGCPVSQ
jgi:hypothetical protein